MIKIHIGIEVELNNENELHEFVSRVFNTPSKTRSMEDILAKSLEDEMNQLNESQPKPKDEMFACMDCHKEFSPNQLNKDGLCADCQAIVEKNEQIRKTESQTQSNLSNKPSYKGLGNQDKVWELHQAGKTTHEICLETGLKPNTVYVYISNGRKESKKPKIPQSDHEPQNVSETNTAKILRLHDEGKSDLEIATIMNMAESTIRGYFPKPSKKIDSINWTEKAKQQFQGLK